MPEDFTRFGGGGDTRVSLVALFIVVVAVLLSFLLPRKYLIVPFLMGSIFIPLSQVFVIGGLHFMMLRIMILFGWVRLILEMFVHPQRFSRLKLNSLDWAVMMWVFTSVVTFSLLWGDLHAFTNRMGMAYNSIGLYFLFRFLICDHEDVVRTIKTLIVICVLLAAFMWWEQITGRNVLATLGDIPGFTPIREGYRRSQAAFAHPILAGTFGATLLPLFVGLWRRGGKSKMLSSFGVLAALAIVVASGASTPVMAGLAGIGALWLWPMRKQMKLLRWGILLSLVALQLVMKAPVWALIGRSGVLSGSSGYHRYMLFDQTIHHFGDWWLLGTKDTNSWGWDMWDTSNFYVENAVLGGILTLIFFLCTIWRSFQGLGKARKVCEANRNSEFFCWAVGSALFSHVVAFFGISYFDQTVVAWFVLLAMIAVVAFSPEAATGAEVTSSKGVAAAVLQRSAAPSFRTDVSRRTAFFSTASDHRRKYERG